MNLTKRMMDDDFETMKSLDLEEMIKWMNTYTILSLSTITVLNFLCTLHAKLTVGIYLISQFVVISDGCTANCMNTDIDIWLWPRIV